MKIINWKNLINLVLVLVWGGLIGISLVKFTLAQKDQKSNKVDAPIEASRGASNLISFDGTVQSEKSVALSFQTSGKLTVLYYQVGDKVSAGSVLAKIDNQNAWENYQQALASEKSAQYQLDQLKYSLKSEKIQLEKLKHSSKKDKKIQKAKINKIKASIDGQKEIIKVKQAQIKLAQIALEHTKLIAPFSGTITQQEIEVGENVTANLPIIKMETLDKLKIEGFASQAQVGEIKLNQKAEVKFGTIGDSKIYQAKIVNIDPSVTFKNNLPTYKINLILSNYPKNIKPGLSASVSIVKDKF